MSTARAFGPFASTICGIDELGQYCDIGVSHVLSLLDPGFPYPQAFEDYGEHDRLDLRFHDVVEDRPGMVAPSRSDVEALLSFGDLLLTEAAGRPHLLVHCHMGVSRSTASMALLLAQALPEVSAEAVLAEVARLRPQAWPNLRIMELGDDLLGRRGQLVVALRKYYRAQLQRDPSRARLMIDVGRGREVEGLDDL